MTPAQKKSRENFKKAVAEAKKLRAKNPKLSQAQAVKQAWAILYSTGKVGKAKTKKATKKKAATKKAVSTHKDTKSHNVNIRVVSGVSNVNKFAIQHVALLNNEIQLTIHQIETIKKELTEPRVKDGKRIYSISLRQRKIKELKTKLALLKKQLTLAKKSIK